jgi:hypothetical protein
MFPCPVDLSRGSDVRIRCVQAMCGCIGDTARTEGVPRALLGTHGALLISAPAAGDAHTEEAQAEQCQGAGQGCGRDLVLDGAVEDARGEDRS